MVVAEVETGVGVTVLGRFSPPSGKLLSIVALIFNISTRLVTAALYSVPAGVLALPKGIASNRPGHKTSSSSKAGKINIIVGMFFMLQF